MDDQATSPEPELDIDGFVAGRRRGQVMIGLGGILVVGAVVAAVVLLMPGPCDKLIDMVCSRGQIDAGLCTQISGDVKALGVPEKVCQSSLDRAMTVSLGDRDHYYADALHRFMLQAIAKREAAGGSIPDTWAKMRDTLAEQLAEPDGNPPGFEYAGD